MLAENGPTLHIVARLPVVANDKAALETLSSVVVAHADNVPIEPDIHYIAIQSDHRHSTYEVMEAFKALYLSAKLLSTGQTSGSQRRWHLMEVAGPISDKHIQHLINNSQGRLTTYRRLGGYFMGLDALIAASALNQEGP